MYALVVLTKPKDKDKDGVTKYYVNRRVCVPCFPPIALVNTLH